MEGSSAPSEVPQLRDIVLCKTPTVEVSIPQKPNIPISEGLHVQVKGEHDATDTPKAVLRRFGVGLGVSKAIAEGSQTPEEPWANTRIEKGQQVSVYGRNITNEDSWRKPVQTDNRVGTQIERLPKPYDQAQLQTLFRRYIPKWEQLTSQVKLFQNGPEGIDHDPSTAAQGDFTLWENDSVKVTIIRNPHLAGLHLMVDAKSSIDRQWQTQRGISAGIAKGEEEPELIRNTLEAAAVALGVQKLLGGGGEIHNSGNWAGDLKTTDEGGKFIKDAFLRNEHISKESLQKLLKTADSQAAIADYMREQGKSEAEITQRIARIGDATEDELRNALLRRTAVAEKRIHAPSHADDASRIGTFMHFHVYLPEDREAPVSLPNLSKGEASERLLKETDQAKQKEYEGIIAAWDAIPTTTTDEMVRVRERIGNGKLNTWLLENTTGALV